MEKQSRKHLLRQVLRRKLFKSPESGFTLIEVLIGLLLLTIIGLVFTSALQRTGRDYQTARLLNRASRVATSEVEACKAIAARGDFTSITDAAYKDGEYDITWQVVDKTVTSGGQVSNTPAGGTANLKEVTITVTHETRKDISVVRTVRVGLP